jgi:hypothetical protein
MCYAGHAAQMEAKRKHSVLVRNLNETNYFRDLGINGWIILKLSEGNWMGDID